MELEEKILHIGSLLCILSLFFPWLSGQWYGSEREWNGFGFYTGYVGHMTLLIQLFVLSMTISPLLGGPVLVRKSQRNIVRFILTGIASILLLSAFTVLLRVTFEVSGAEMRFGITTTLIGAVLSLLYSFLRYQEQRHSEVHGLFRHPDEVPPPSALKKPTATQEEFLPPPPAPPLPPPPEDHQPFTQP